jgi:hypothetical protein
MTAKRSSDSQTRRRSAAQSQAAIAALARRHAEAALAALVEVMGDRSATAAARISAASAVLTWGFGRATAAGEGEDGENGKNGPTELVIRWLTPQDARPATEAPEATPQQETAKQGAVRREAKEQGRAGLPSTL